MSRRSRRQIAAYGRTPAIHSGITPSKKTVADRGAFQWDVKGTLCQELADFWV